jgi:hypothetical protein
MFSNNYPNNYSKTVSLHVLPKNREKKRMNQIKRKSEKYFG